MSRSRFRTCVAALAAGALLAGAAGCGGGSSSSSGSTTAGGGSGASGAGKPGYCADRAALNSDVQGLTVPTSSDQIDALKAQLTTIQSGPTQLVDSAKADYPDETSAIQSSVDTLSTDVDALPASPTTAQIAAIAADTTGVVGAVKNFSDASTAKCE